MSLADVQPGSNVRVVEIDGGRGMAGRLSTLGLIPGTEVSVLSRRGGGPVLVALRRSRLAIGHGLARRVRVEPVPESGTGCHH
ncbi:ferrous iron transport protein A [candidate division WOR-3 bacterium]|uniref:Ferrous iron transport protein A n=1 Tax=candidate division WOR-3 bacterium TaxID=2052148 RepID=A0A937XBY1_UNCW3|nr:ferrous iron transport protein A [candidate division WOR-3 bacterium]